jgi:hypothetical protein
LPTAEADEGRAGWFVGTAAMIAAAGVALAVVRPFAVGPVGFDSASSVAFFQHIVAGHRLESYVSTTPKPLLTVVYGVLYGVSADWRLISWATIVAFSVSVWLAARLTLRLAGVAAAIFVAIGLVALPLIDMELIVSYAVPWAMVGWFSAALLATGPRPKYGWAGVALMLATLARLETLALLGLLLAVLGALWLGHRLGAQRFGRRLSGLPAPPPRAWLLSIGLLALPVMLVHDWLLTGNPVFWTLVSQAYSVARPAAVRTPGLLRRALDGRYLHQPILSALAVVGGLWLLRERRVAIVLGLVGLGPGVAALLLLLAARGTYVSTRYFAAIDVAVVVAAAIGVGAIVAGLRPRLAARHVGGRRLAVVAVGLAVVAAVAAQPHPAPLSSATLDSAAAERTLNRDADQSLPALRAALNRIAGSRQDPPAGVDWHTGTAPPPVLLGPAQLRPRLAVDLAMPLSNVAGLQSTTVVPGPNFLGCASLILHDRVGDSPLDGYTILEIDAPVTIGGDVLLTPLIAQPAAGYWLIEVTRSGAAAAACEALRG